MLSELRVRDFAIIERLSVRLGPGLNVLTGETGAGKSIIIGALGIALGERAYSEMIKTGKEQASVEALFDVSPPSALKDMGIDPGQELILRRDISRSGKGRAYVNDTAVSVQGLAVVGKGIVDIHGQHEHQSLLWPEGQLRLLDAYGKLGGLKEQVSALYFETQTLKKRLDDMKLGARDRAQRIDLLKYQLGEISSAQLSAGEDASLERERALLQNLARLSELAETAYAGIYGSEGSCVERLSDITAKVREMASVDPEALETLRLLESAEPLISEAATALRDIRGRYELDPGRLVHVDDRLDLIKNLKRKYGDTLDAVIEYWERISKELAAVETSEEDSGALKDALSAKDAELLAATKKLTSGRKKAAKEIETAVVALLKDLALKNARLSIEIGDAQPGPAGADSVEFMFSANTGEALKPLSKVASGGELSRVMLAVKSVISRADDVPVLVFDEVDAGIGGKTAGNVAMKLKEIAGGRQVICITHLPQIASAADRHFLIEKAETGGGISVKIEELTGSRRREEIARMLSGKVTEASLKHADELLGKGR